MHHIRVMYGYQTGSKAVQQRATSALGHPLGCAAAELGFDQAAMVHRKRFHRPLTCCLVDSKVVESGGRLSKDILVLLNVDVLIVQ